MAHLNTELLTDYWRERLPASGSPPRSSIDPTQFVDLLPQVFILGRAAPGRYEFRLVGGLIGDLHGRSLRGQPFLPLWASLDRPTLQLAMEGAVRRNHPLVVHAQGHSVNSPGPELEVLLAPVAGPGGGVDRFLGLYQSLTPLAGLMERAIDQLSVRRIGAGVDPRRGEPMAEAPRLRLAALNGRRIA